MIGSLQLTRLYDVTNYQFIVEQVGAAAGGMLGGLMDVVKDASSAVIPGSSKPSGLTTRTSTTTTTRPGMPQVSVPARRRSFCSHLSNTLRKLTFSPTTRADIAHRRNRNVDFRTHRDAVSAAAVLFRDQSHPGNGWRSRVSWPDVAVLLALSHALCDSFVDGTPEPKAGRTL